MAKKKSIRSWLWCGTTQLGLCKDKDKEDQKTINIFVRQNNI